MRAAKQAVPVESSLTPAEEQEKWLTEATTVRCIPDATPVLILRWLDGQAFQQEEDGVTNIKP
jgi:hypothetical protein